MGVDADGMTVAARRAWDRLPALAAAGSKVAVIPDELVGYLPLEGDPAGPYCFTLRRDPLGELTELCLLDDHHDGPCGYDSASVAVTW